MNNLSLRQKIIAAVIALGLGLIALFSMGLYHHSPAPLPPSASSQNQVADENKPKLISTNPTSLDLATIVPTQVIELNFSQSLVGELDVHITLDPKIDFKLTVSADHKTAKITPIKPYDLGQSYTLNVTSGTRFEGDKTLDHDYTYHFKTLPYNGV